MIQDILKKYQENKIYESTKEWREKQNGDRHHCNDRRRDPLGRIRCMRTVHVSKQRSNSSVARVCASGSSGTSDAMLLFPYRQRADPGNLEK